MQFTKEFEDFLKDTPVALAKFLEILQEFIRLQGKGVDLGAPPAGPEEFTIGGSPTFKTVGLTHDDLDALARGAAEAAVKEKALAWVKGFIAGLMIAA